MRNQYEHFLRLARHLRSQFDFLKDHDYFFLVGAAIFFTIFVLSFTIGLGDPIIPSTILSQFFGFVCLLIVLLLVGDFIFVQMIDTRDEQIKSLLSTLSKQTEHLEFPFVFDSQQWVYDISPDGTGHTTRISTIMPTVKPIYLFSVSTGAIGDALDLEGTKRLNLVATGVASDGQEFPLLHYVVKDEARQKRHCIVLRKPVGVTERETIKVKYDWPGAWNGLLVSGKDIGVLGMEHEVSTAEFKMRAPVGYRIIQFYLEPRIAEPEILIDSDRRSVVRWVAHNLPSGFRIKYQIEVVRIESSRER